MPTLAIRPNAISTPIALLRKSPPDTPATTAPGVASIPCTVAPDEDAVRRWLERIGAERVVIRSPGVYGLQSLPSGWSLECPQGLSEHLIHFVISGACTVSVGHEQRRLGSGSILWIRPGTPFVLRRAEHRQTVVHCLRLTRDPDGDAGLGPALCVEDAWDLRSTFDLLTAELPSTLPHRDEHIRGLLLVLLTALFRRTQWRPNGGVLSSSARHAIEEFVDSSISARPRVADLARVAGLSPDYFTRVFRRTFGVPPREWMVRRRIQRATLLLDSGNLSVSQVAAALGYTDSFLFSRQFKAVMGIAPQNYRAR
ncbi:helix-turn-helix domain-containing protein [Streptomyces sp. NPDC085932]|uniref:helix-turn-helix domain-containing protein n=1 Tax=Streptomyces sp. NPDC085932 TaxID=3365741 RepID=UPI0037D2CCCC